MNRKPNRPGYGVKVAGCVCTQLLPAWELLGAYRKARILVTFANVEKLKPPHYIDLFTVHTF